MRMRYTIFYFAGIFTVMPLLFSSCELLKKYPHDNVIEEAIEDLIEAHTGIEIDLTPCSPEGE